MKYNRVQVIIRVMIAMARSCITGFFKINSDGMYCNSRDFPEVLSKKKRLSNHK